MLKPKKKRATGGHETVLNYIRAIAQLVASVALLATALATLTSSTPVERVPRVQGQAVSPDGR